MVVISYRSNNLEAKKDFNSNIYYSLLNQQKIFPDQSQQRNGARPEYRTCDLDTMSD